MTEGDQRELEKTQSRSLFFRGRRGLLTITLFWCVGALSLGFAVAAPRITVPPPAKSRLIIPAETVEKVGASNYRKLVTRARRAKRLLPKNDPRYRSLSRIMKRMIPFAESYNPRAALWKWELAVIRGDQVNAACFPGGKIFFYTGIIDKLELSEAERAAVMGHEMAHALWEHGREQLAKGGLVRGLGRAFSTLTGLPLSRLLADLSSRLLTLKFSRSNETEADLIGLEIMARAGFEPRASLSLWEKMSGLHAQKQENAAKRIPQNEEVPKSRFGRIKRWIGQKARQISTQAAVHLSTWWSTHPRSEARREKLQEQLPLARQIYEVSRRQE
ncbi:MAG: M48 family metallopeptidase [Myxococcota bacterium]|nr:M48 family metallopeptidase [Myxococcota bacterium]